MLLNAGLWGQKWLHGVFLWFLLPQFHLKNSMIGQSFHFHHWLTCTWWRCTRCTRCTRWTVKDLQYYDWRSLKDVSSYELWNMFFFHDSAFTSHMEDITELSHKLLADLGSHPTTCRLQWPCHEFLHFIKMQLRSITIPLATNICQLFSSNYISTSDLELHLTF